MKQKTKVNLLGREIEIILHSERNEQYQGCVRQEKDRFIIEFFGLVTDYILIHECWHCLFRVLWTLDNAEHVFAELKDEIYAYVFSEFCADVIGKVTHLKLYHKMWDEKNDKKGKD